MPRILVTNDDGYFSAGLAALAQALEAVGDYEAIEKGLVSSTSLRTDLTDYRALEALRSWTALQ